MSYNPIRSLTTVRDSLDRLISQFKGKTILAAELTSYLNRIQEIEDTLWDIILGRSLGVVLSPGGVTLASASGIQLDTIGKIVGCPRAGLSDTDYLVALAAQIYVNRSQGIAENFLHLLRISSPDTALPWTITDHYPATVHVQIFGTVSWAVLVTWRYLQKVKGAGIKLLFTYTTSAPTSTFMPYDSSGSVPADSASYGYGSTTDATVGGNYASTLGV